MREHVLHFFFAILGPLIAVEVRVGVERERYGPGLFDAFEEAGIDKRAVFEPVPGIIAGILFKYTFIRFQSHIDRDIAVGMDADTEVVRNSVVNCRVDSLLRHRQDAVVVRSPKIGRRHTHCALGRGSVSRILYGAYAQHVVSEARVDTCIFQ